MGPRPLACLLALAVLLNACAQSPAASAPSATPSTAPSATLARVTQAPTAAPTAVAMPTALATPTSSPTPASTANLTPCQREIKCALILNAVDSINPYHMDAHLGALTSFVSRDVHHPGHAKAQAYIKEQLNALGYYGWKI